MTRGVVYIASGPSYIRKAVRSANSVKRNNPDLNVSLFTDDDIDPSVFDNVVQSDRAIRERGDSILSEQHMVYDKNLYLDADTYVCQSVEELFDILERDNIAAAHNEARTWYHQDVYEQLETNIPETFTEYNTGVVAYRRSSEVKELFKMWDDTHTELDYNRNQPAFRVALYRSDIDVTTLPPEYNFMTHTIGFASGDVKILHEGPSDEDLSEWAELLNSVDGKKVTSWEAVPCRVIPNRYQGKRYRIKKTSTEDIRETLQRARMKWERDGTISLARSGLREGMKFIVGTDR